MERKFIVAQKSEIDEGEKTIIGWASKPTVDRDKELILSDAWNLDGYLKNPVIILAHNYNDLPIGKALWVKKTGQGLKFKARFANTERGKEVYQLYKDGILNCFSVGFAPRVGGVQDNPVDARYKGVKRLFTDVDLLEISCVPIPSNQDAVIDQSSFVKHVREGKIVTKQLKEELEGIVEIIEKDVEGIEIEETEVKAVTDKETVVEKADFPEGLIVKVETTENYVHVPAPGEEGEHKDHQIRTVELSKKEGIKGKYCVDDKKMISYMFDSETWDEEKATKWVEEHKKFFAGIELFGDTDNISIIKGNGDWTGIDLDEDGDIVFKASDEIETKAISPMEDEEMTAFMDRCMSDKAMMGEHSEDDERKNACQMKWDEKKEKKDETPTEIKEGADIEDFTEAISALCEQIETLKKNMAATSLESGKVDAGIQTKTADAEGNPSLYDLTFAINNALNDPQNNAFVRNGEMNCWCNVVDIYATEFPGGHVVYSANVGMDCEYYRIDYSYNKVTRKVSLAGTKTEVLQSWVEERYGEQEMQTMAVDEDEIIQKEGRVLSEMNRQMMSECITQLTEAIQALKDLVAATDKTPKVIPGAQSVEDLFKGEDDAETKDFLEIEEKTIDGDILELEDDNGMIEVDEDILKAAIESALSKSFKIDVAGTVETTVARLKGRVVK